MLKIAIALSILISSNASLATPIIPGMSVKERLRLSLWYEGIEDKPKAKIASKKQYPEEIERALRKM
jgi:hypothetical protein